MDRLHAWFYIIVAVLIALAANSISTIWAGKENKFTIWLLLLLIISPLVFITFGIATSKIGLVISSGTIDALLTISTILVGLFIFNEWNTLSIYQYIGVAFSVAGIILMQFHK
jgi:multidrug transporter EmrE-like cation transporter